MDALRPWPVTVVVAIVHGVGLCKTSFYQADVDSLSLSLSLSLSISLAHARSRRVSFSSAQHTSRLPVSPIRVTREKKLAGAFTEWNSHWKWSALSRKPSVGDELQFSLRMTNLLERISVENGGHTREARHTVRNGGQCTLTEPNETNRGIERRELDWLAPSTGDLQGATATGRYITGYHLDTSEGAEQSA
ncbi:uncharacterized protein N7498_010179 [Penicillium cinerascens]|uniref:Uncharacterized protein n=1 Tax=Penicillium cinerascens TaxID=70096 RepID=A0A9W9J7G2_9EURO|nr:uncharacterized protein N7498_010179 [Penicillium cinerascens]KAJ5191194.1 hypothetical protein N7498_010179 [Penicillium cinerascens]